MMNKRGQSAVEYLTTYGLALVAIVIIVGALFALGILNPLSYQTDTCRGFVKLQYRDHGASADGNFNLTLRNGSGKTIAASGASVDIDCNLDGAPDGNAVTNAAAWGASREETFSFPGPCSATFSANDPYEIDLNLTYTPGSGFTKTESATCVGTVTP
ncbi:MAG TPA: hypothetical protein VJK05_00620 [archaeon]|nr:hypothetical protein [archaeon]